MSIPGHNILTHSRMACFKRCPREHQYRYEMGIVPAGDSAPLRFGSMIHEAIDQRAKGTAPNETENYIRHEYAKKADLRANEDEVYSLAVECETVLAMIDGYFKAWATDYKQDADHPLTPIECIESEIKFDMPIYNPETGRKSKAFSVSGKIDAIVRLSDGRIAVKETKTTSDSIDPSSDYWRKLRIDHQISLYLLAAKHANHEAVTVLYDVIRKPGIAPKQVAELDANGLKVVVDLDGKRVFGKNGQPRQSADKEQGYTLVSRIETPQEFGVRLREDIAQRPDFYYARQEIPRLTADMQEFSHELWQQQQAIREAQKHGRWYRNPAQCSAMGRCRYLDVCHQGFTPDNVPNGFVKLTHLHTELA